MSEHEREPHIDDDERDRTVAEQSKLIRILKRERAEERDRADRLERELRAAQRRLAALEYDLSYYEELNRRKGQE